MKRLMSLSFIGVFLVLALTGCPDLTDPKPEEQDPDIPALEIAIASLIQTAEAAKNGVKTSPDGNDIAANELWVTQGSMDSLNNAITKLQEEPSDENYLVLEQAIGAFNNAKQNGKKAPELRIDGLPGAWNGTKIRWFGLYTTKAITGNAETGGDGTVQDGTMQAPLYLSIDESGDTQIPWNGRGSYYVAFNSWLTGKYYITRSAVSFNTDPRTINFSAFEVIHMSEPSPADTAGYINGTINFSGSNETLPSIRIRAEYSGGQGQYSNGFYAVNDEGAFSIPFTPQFLYSLQDGEQTIRFQLEVGPWSKDWHYYIDIEGDKNISTGDLSNDNIIDVDSLGTINLAAITLTLSGTITVNNSGNPIPRIQINAERDEGGERIGRTSLWSVVSSSSWSMTIPVQQPEKITFRVSGYDSPSSDGTGGNQLFYEVFKPTETDSVSNSDISGIDLTIGDINEDGS